MQKKYPLSEVLPNPFRNIELYPINESKVQALMESYDRTGYWGNIVGRPCPSGVEIAYGHHRIEAMRRKHKKSHEVDIITKPISDSDMLRIMADENMQEWGTNSIIEQETVRAVVLAYAAGKIELPKVHKATKPQYMRYAPRFSKLSAPITGADKPYTDQTIADFLGWKQPDGRPSLRIVNALEVLETAEQLDAHEEIKEITTGLASEVAKVTVQRMKTVEKAHRNAGASPTNAKGVAIKAGRHYANLSRGGKATVASIRTDVGFMPSSSKKECPIPDIDEFCQTLVNAIDLFFHSETQLRKNLGEVIRHKSFLDSERKNSLVRSINSLSTRCDKLVTLLTSEE